MENDEYTDFLKYANQFHGKPDDYVARYIIVKHVMEYKATKKNAGLKSSKTKQSKKGKAIARIASLTKERKYRNHE